MNMTTHITYNSTIFVGTGTQIDLGKDFRFRISTKECIYYCLRDAICDTVFVAYTSNTNDIRECKYFGIGSNAVSLESISSDGVSTEPWLSFWPGGIGVPDHSQLIMFNVAP